MFGLEQKEIPFILEINADGELLQMQDTREISGKKKVAHTFQNGHQRPLAWLPILLWDTLEYVLGINTKRASLSEWPSNTQRFAPALQLCRMQPEGTQVFKP